MKLRIQADAKPYRGKLLVTFWVGLPDGPAPIKVLLQNIKQGQELADKASLELQWSLFHEENFVVSSPNLVNNEYQVGQNDLTLTYSYRYRYDPDQYTENDISDAFVRVRSELRWD